ncbi:Na(+)/H(+) exchange regulatory cofactor NHE-RF2 [Clupea harengus]|uniref:Na(+)/H(+) exchange regulatory cofactor NHE-RF2 n=1 Tax=Clupea harengus TaxID=7950 RepID=A0A6P3VRP7_CLUHA|nr:Na(+)/H(+) exchange regulatory cofactor NHE-RF2 [Clupea harengus]
MKMAHSLERELVLKEMMRPRLCYITKGERGYGFHLHGEKNKGAQFIRKIDPGSPADLSGLRSGDRVVEVNGENVEKDPHHVVVEKIRTVEHRTRLLVVDRETDEYLRFHELSCTEDRAVEMGSLSPRTSVTSSPRTSATSSPRASATPSPCASFTVPSPTENMARATRTVSPLLMDECPTIHNDQKIPSSPSAVSNGSVVHQFHSRLASPVPLAPVSEHSTDISASETSTPESSPLPPRDHRPRLYHLTKAELGYGFNLHSDKVRMGQFIRCVDPDSPAEYAGLRPKDRLVEVNGMNIEHLRHSEVVAVIRRGGGQTSLLVVDPETDELFKALGITPTCKHLEEDCVDGPFKDYSPTESSPSPVTDESVSPSPVTDESVSPSPVTDSCAVPPPVINVTVMDPSVRNGSPHHCSQDSSSSQSTLSDMSAELSSSDTSFKVVDEDDRPTLDPFWQSGLRLSPTAAQAKLIFRENRAKKKAPPMDWSKKQQLFSNF